MNAGAAAQRYNTVARALHWVIALLVVGNLIGGFVHEAFEHVVRIIPVHKAVGLTILALSLLRLAWRIAARPPALPAEMPLWERGSAHVIHAMFYVLMIAMPLSGWLFSSAGKYPLTWFGLFDVPKFAVAKDSTLYAVTHGGHMAMAWLFLALVVLHVTAALRHHLVLKDTVLRRML